MNVVPNFLRGLLGNAGPTTEAEQLGTSPSDLNSSRNRERRESFGRIAPRPTTPAPYDTPDPSGKCWIIELPEDALVKVFQDLDGVSLARSMRVCKTINDLLTSNPHLALQNLLTFSSLRLNPHAVIPSRTNLLTPPSPAELLARLRDKLDRFARLDPARTVSMRLQETEGRLYEYLEGILLKSVGMRTSLPTTLGIYDLRGVGSLQGRLAGAAGTGGGTQVEAGSEEGGGDGEGLGEEDEDDWADVEEGDEVVEKIRRTKTFGFTVAEFAVDPGQDLLVLVEVLPQPPRQYQIRFHLLSLETLEAHPLASQPILEWPSTVTRRDISLGFQICDDGLYVLNHNLRSQSNDQLYGWQWTTGRLAITLKAFPTQTFESFILLSPNSILIPTIITHLDPTSMTQDDLGDPTDLTWTHHLHLYAFPPLSSAPLVSNEPTPPPHSVTHIATFDLPKFVVDLMDEMPPPRMTIRTDPPPRHTFPTHPVESVQPFVPTPESGVIIMEFYCQMPDDEFPRYVLACPKRALIQYLPAPTSPLLTQGWPRQAPVVKWETLAPKVRMFGPDMIATSWVCYVYQDRYAASTSSRRDEDDPADYMAKVRLYDFNPLRVKREISRRAIPSEGRSQFTKTLKRKASRVSRPVGASATDGEQDGITLITDETILLGELPLAHEVKTGAEFPYTFAEKDSQAEVWLLDDERLIGVFTPDLEGKSKSSKPRIEVMEF